MFKSMITMAMISAATPIASASVLPNPVSEGYSQTETQTCEPVTMRLYFQNGDAVLSTSAHRVIKEMSAQLEGCHIADIELTATVSDARSAEDAAELGRDRLAMVASVLRDEGLLTRIATGRIEHSAPGQSLPMTRRVDVTLSATGRALS